MGIGGLINEYLWPLGLAAMLLLVVVFLFAGLARRGIAGQMWQAITSHPIAWGLFAIMVLAVVAFGTYLNRAWDAQRLEQSEHQNVSSPSNLVGNPVFAMYAVSDTTPLAWTVAGTVKLDNRASLIVEPQSAITSSVVIVRPGASYRYNIRTEIPDSSNGNSASQVRLIWYDPSLRPLSWMDSDVWPVDFTRDTPSFHTGVYQAPLGATRLKVTLFNKGSNRLWASNPKLSQEGVYIEPLPNGTQGALAFSFDWESAMGGPIHSKGMEVHDRAGAAQHGLEMRQGAEWLNKLFARYTIKATFYATGYNFLDGNPERRAFSGNPTYQWAIPKYGWQSDYWLTHPWYSDDPYGTTQSDSAWYFGDQTRTLLSAGHEIASHTFGHLYVRGSNPKELATDMDEWLSAAKAIGVPAPTTFAFPWRSSNSLSADYYDVLYQRGIRAVTRLYGPDLKDLYTISAPLVYTDNIANAKVYSSISVMPDFLLGAPSGNAGEEAAGGGISRDEGLRAISETLARRGTTSFWQHPEQLISPSVQSTWQDVVAAAAGQRDKGRLWIGTVADITAYETAAMSVTATLDNGFLGLGGWKMQVHNDSGKELSGVTVTMPGDVSKAFSKDTQVLTIYHPDPDTTRLSAPDKPQYLARQLVLPKLKPGVTTIELEWASGQEPPR